MTSTGVTPDTADAADAADTAQYRQSRHAAQPRRRAPAAWGAAGLATVLAVLWLLVVPEKVASVSGWQEAVIRWGHPLCWILLAALAVVLALGASPRVRTVTAVAAALCYATLLAAVLL